MAKKINVILKKDGVVGISFEGFSGNSCYEAAEQIKKRLLSLGIQLDVKITVPHDEALITKTEKERINET